MRERLLQLLPEIDVPRVTGVPGEENLRKHCIYDENSSGTLLTVHSVTGVSEKSCEEVHQVHQKRNDVYQQKTNKISVGTPVTPGTPIFVQGVIEAYEERAAIMEFDASDIYPDRKLAETEAYKILINRKFDGVFRPLRAGARVNPMKDFYRT